MRLVFPPMEPAALWAALALAIACGGGGEVGEGGTLRSSVDEERGVAFVEPEDVRAYVEAGNGDIVFVDNRNAFAFQQQRIRGARLIPTDQMSRSLGSLPLNKWLILYCT